MTYVNPTQLEAQLGRDMRGPSAVIWLSGAAVLVFVTWAAFARDTVQILGG